MEHLIYTKECVTNVITKHSKQISTHEPMAQIRALPRQSDLHERLLLIPCFTQGNHYFEIHLYFAFSFIILLCHMDIHP